MLKKLFHKFQGDRKYFAVVFFLFVLILFSAFRTPSTIENIRSNWDEILAGQIEDIEFYVHNQFDKKMLSLANTTNLIKSDLRNVFVTGDEAYREIIKTLNKKNLRITQ